MNVRPNSGRHLRLNRFLLAQLGQKHENNVLHADKICRLFAFLFPIDPSDFFVRKMTRFPYLHQLLGLVFEVIHPILYFFLRQLRIEITKKISASVSE